jgi:excisionase family DNA binding protein
MAKRELMLGPRMEKLGLTVPEAAALSSLGQTSIYKAIKEGRLRIRKYGTRTIIPRADRPSQMDSPNAQTALIGVTLFFGGRVAKSAKACITMRRFLRASPRL